MTNREELDDQFLTLVANIMAECGWTVKTKSADGVMFLKLMHHISNYLLRTCDDPRFTGRSDEQLIADTKEIGEAFLKSRRVHLN